MGKLSPHDSSFEALMAKLGAAWLTYLVGLNLQEWLSLILTLLSIIYVFFNTFVLLRDQVLKRREKKAEEKRKTDFGDLKEGD